MALGINQGPFIRKKQKNWSIFNLRTVDQILMKFDILEGYRVSELLL